MEHKNNHGQHKIAIVGTGSLFPGALSTKDFWLNILAEKDFVKDVPASHWLKEDYFDPTDKTGDKVYCQKGGFLDDIAFDPVEFGMPPNLLSTTDTVQLLSLVVARDTLADTLSYQAGKVDPKRVSVILGVAGGTELIGQMSARIHTPEWVMAMRKQGLPESQIQAITEDLGKSYTKWNENTFPGLLGNVVSGRIANRFDLKGTNCVLDAACASSLAAVKMAVQELQLGTTDMVISGGADALNDIFMYMCFSKTTALSPTEDCRPFSDAGDGTVLGEGVAMMSLKRLEDAERDGDRIYAVITSIGSSSDGKSGSIYAPDSNGQSLAIRRAYDAAGFAPAEIGLVEGHGTGTMAGDYAEFNGLKLGYGDTDQLQYCALGSVKSMIGHTKSAAGAASVLKVAMALNNAVLPPTIKVDRPNPKLNIEQSPFYLNTRARPWIQPEASTRKAGVSSMGFGGTNFHVAMEAYDKPAAQPMKVYRAQRELLLFSGQSSAEIAQALTAFAAQAPAAELVQLAKTSQAAFNPAHICRLAILGESVAEVLKWAKHVQGEWAKKSAKVDVNNSVYYAEGTPSGKVAFLFSGQGSQYVNMGTDLLLQYDAALGPWNRAAALDLAPGKRLNHLVYPIPVFTPEARQAQTTALVATEWAQPAIGVLALSHLALLNQLGVQPSVVGGHSYGEVAALYAAGVITNETDLVNISRKRGELMAAASSVPGAMTAVFADAAAVAAVLAAAATSVVIANVNSPGQTVVTGPATAIAEVETALTTAALRFQRLNVATAFHSELVAGSAADFATYLNTISFGQPTVPVYSNTTAAPYTADTTTYATVLANQLAAPVQFQQQVAAMYAEGVRVFVEVGPGKVLSHFVKDTLNEQSHRAISMDGGAKLNSKDAFWSALGQMAVAGVPLAFANIWEGLDDNHKVAALKKPSIATVQINGTNYGKPYPPQGGFASLPKPNPEKPLGHTPAPLAPAPVPSVAAAAVAAAAPITAPAPPRPQPVAQAPVARPMPSQPSAPPVRLNGSPISSQVQAKTTMSGVNNQWLQAFQEIQHNALQAQQRFQETLADSHRLFLETSQVAFHHLGNLAGQNSSSAPIMAPASPRQLALAPVASAPAMEIPAPRPVAVAAPVALPVAPAVLSAPVSIPAPRPEPAPQSVAAAVTIDFEAALLAIVADKTGYPVEILDLSMDLESGLGIDSIKRVEILSALQEEFPALKGADKAKLAAMNTLAEILAFSRAHSPESAAGSAPAVAAAATVPINFEDTMMQIVADKTGYPKEILDLGTDLESGLGIDSIKRVEILSALQEVFPELKNVDKAKLAAMNTLGEILSFANGSTPAAAPATGATPSAATPAVPGEISLDTFQNAMLRTVADKTGYPVEILDLSMDLESGLGIDSIKRVEILSALQEEFPALKGADKAKLAAMNTLGEIMEFAGAAPAGEKLEPVAQKKKLSPSGSISRYVVARALLADSGFGNIAWKKADVLYLLEDNAGVAPELGKLFESAGVITQVVDALPVGAASVVDLRGLNQGADYTPEQAMAANGAAFAVAQQVGPQLQGGQGCLLLAFDNGLARADMGARSWAGGISALAKTAKLEWPTAEVQALNIDSHGKAPATVAAELFQAITTGGIAAEMEIDAAGKSWQLVATAAEVADRTKGLRDGDTLVVSGGARGVTAACLLALAERTKLNIGILGRTRLEEEPAYLQHAQTDAELKNSVFQQATKEGRKVTPKEVNALVLKTLGNREVAENLRQLRQLGAEVRYLSADIANAAEVTAAVAELRTEFGSIQGIVHAAGVLADKLILEKTAEQFKKVFSTKIEGFRNLLDATAADALTHICCFSSVAARMGNVGQVDYAMANEVLNKVCQAEQARRGPACVVKSLNWGPWDGGMVSPQLKQHFNAMGVALIPLEEGAEIFANEMEDASTAHVEVVVGGAFDNWGAASDPAARTVHSMWIHRANNAFLDSHRIQGKVIVPMMMANEWSMRLAQSVCPGLQVVAVKKVKVYKGIQLDQFDQGGDVLHFGYTVERATSAAQVAVKIENDKGQLLYGVTVHLAPQKKAGRRASSSFPNLNPWTWDKEEIYESQLFHGPAFQVIDKLEGISEENCVGALKMDVPVVIDDAVWLSDMFLFDGGIQVATLAMSKWTGNNSSLPMGYDSLHLYEAAGRNQHMSCELTLKKKGSQDSEWDIQFKGQDQQLLAEMTGLRMYMYQAN